MMRSASPRTGGYGRAMPLPRLARLLPRLTRTVTAGSARSGRASSRQEPRPGADGAADARGTYPGDHEGPLRITSGTTPFGIDVGEVVWSWVPYEEDHSQGKDRPVLVVGAETTWLLALPLTSADHDVDEDQERRAGRHWIDVGSGGWDRQRRRSEARVDRVVRVDPEGVRRAGGNVEPHVLAAVAEAVQAVAEGRGYDDDPV